MAQTELHALLLRLHAELGAAPAPDDETRRLLDVVADDIRRLGGNEFAAGDPAGNSGVAAPSDARAMNEGPVTTPSSLEALAVRFEADHPSAAAALRQVADLLGKAGI